MTAGPAAAPASDIDRQLVELLRDLVAGWARKMNDPAEHAHFAVEIVGEPRHASPTATPSAESCRDPRCRSVRFLRSRGVRP